MILSPTGGLVYHLRAWRNRQAWGQTRTVVSETTSNWLNSLDHGAHADRLILFGPSAGYLMDLEFVLNEASQLKEVLVVEPDPVARAMWSLRWRRLPLKLRRQIRLRIDARPDHLPWWTVDANHFAQWLTEHGPGAVLFFGLLGQIELLSPSFVRPTSEARQLLIQALRPRPWASLHDVWSWPDAQTQIDHDTDWLNRTLETEDRAKIHWPLTPKLRHELSFRSHRASF